MNILVTGAKGFMGKNLMAALEERAAKQSDLLFPIDIDTPEAELSRAAKQADFVFHLAGVNRPTDEADYGRGNGDFTLRLLHLLEEGKGPPVLLSSSQQAALDNPYGASKRVAENAVRAYGERLGQPVMIYRLTNAFGKWSRPHYNSAVATFCHSIARGLPIQVNDPSATLRLNYIDDIVAEFLRALGGSPTREGNLCVVRPEHSVTLGRLSELLYHFRDSRDKFEVVDQSDPFVRDLYATYLSFLPADDFARRPAVHCDARGSFSELLHMNGYGQISVNVSKPHVTKGEHWHHTKHEKFVVVSGRGVIRLRRLGDVEVYSYPVSGELPAVVDIPPGYTHNIENLGDTDMITLMWANENFDPESPDTYRLSVHMEDL